MLPPLAYNDWNTAAEEEDPTHAFINSNLSGKAPSGETPTGEIPAKPATTPATGPAVLLTISLGGAMVYALRKRKKSREGDPR